MENHQTPAGASVYTITHKTAGQPSEWRRERASALSEIQRKRSDARQTTAALELRAETDGVRTLRSYASLFDTPYTIRSSSHRFEEIVRAGAFKRSLGSGPDVVFRAEHSGPPLARTSSGTLRLGEDDRGLWYEADLNPADPDVQALIPKIERGDLRESSFAFRVMGENGDRWSDDFGERELLACDINRGDVSIVTFGASAATGQHMILRSALEAAGSDAALRARSELLENEQRLGAMISSASMDFLRGILDAFVTIDNAADRSLEDLSGFIGVPNPDSDADEDDGRSGGDNIGGGPSGLEVRLAPNDTDELRLLREYRATRGAR